MKEIKKIYESKNYSQFLFMKGNRNINKKKLTRMTKRMQACIEAQSIPFLVIRVTTSTKNNKFFISDGQHTYLVLKNLGLPINFYIVPNESITQVRVLNSDMTNWSIWDYVTSYADTEHSEYIKLINLRNKYKNIIQNEIFINLSIGDNSTNKGYKEIIKNGNFKFENYYEVLKKLDMISDFKLIKGIKTTNYLFLKAVIKLIDYEKYNHDRMINQLRKYPSITRMTDINGYLEELVYKYNYNIRKNDKIHIYELKGV